MNSWVVRVFSKIGRLWFTICYRSVFRVLGQGAFMAHPFRLDGPEGVEVGEGTTMQRGGWLYCAGVDGVPASLTLGNGCILGYNNHIAAVRDVVIGDHVLTANNVYISDNLHDYEDITRPVMHQPVQFKRGVSIGAGCWIGENACIIGARIGKNCVIGANAVVTHDIPDYSVAVGVPAVVIRTFDQQLKKWVPIGSA